MSNKTRFSIGQMVAPKFDPHKIGAIIEITQGTKEIKYKVFQDGVFTTYYESQLTVQEQEKHHDFLSLPQFHAHLSALHIWSRSQSILHSLNTAKINFIPYQFRPVIKFIRADRPRLLIADSVGVGKTIEAGLILHEMQARQDIESVLIICPKSLITERKWEIEMKRFNEEFVPLNGAELRRCIRHLEFEEEWPTRSSKVIISYSLFDEKLLFGKRSKKSGQKGLLDLDIPPQFDLVIVDEAHHIRNVETYKHKAVRYFCDNAKSVLFLTATPIQLHSNDLFILLNSLRPDLIIDKEGFEFMAQPNTFINKAVSYARTQQNDWIRKAYNELTKAGSTEWGKAVLSQNPIFNKVKAKLEHNEIKPEERIELINDVESLHTFSTIINRTRRRDIDTYFVQRKPETVRIDFTLQQEALHNKILEIQADIFSRLHGEKNVKFMMTTIRRQAASCLFGLVPFLGSILTRHIDDAILEEADQYYDDSGVTIDFSLKGIESQIKTVLEMAKNLDSSDPKLDALIKIVFDKQKLVNNKLMIFSSFRHTLKYLENHLRERKFRVGLIHGGVDDENRRIIRNRFSLDRENDEALDVMLFSEVGSEGLDYQFCDCIVNYDLPWNPMRVEQRIGRIDRIGQKSEAIVIYNLITPGTVDADIYDRCLWRIGMFQQALGGNEEILGKITEAIREVSEDFNLTPKERRERLQQKTDKYIRDILEEQRYEEQQHELFGVKLPAEQIETDVEETSSFWLAPKQLQNLVCMYFNKQFGAKDEHIRGAKGLKSIRLSSEERNTLLHDFESIKKRIQNKTIVNERGWTRWLKGNESYLKVTFDGTCSLRHPEAIHLSSIHPLILQASQAYLNQEVTINLSICDNSYAPGEYHFIVYQWNIYGITEDSILQGICSCPEIGANLFDIIQKDETRVLRNKEIPGRELFSDLEDQHYTLWDNARNEHKERIAQIINYKRESLKKSHQARINLYTEQLNRVKDERIQRMRQAQIDNAEAEFQRRLEELTEAASKADIVANKVAFGVLKITLE